MRRHGSLLASVAMVAAMGLTGPMYNPGYIYEPQRGWNGFLGKSTNNKKKRTNKLRASHNAKLKRRKAA